MLNLRGIKITAWTANSRNSVAREGQKKSSQKFLVQGESVDEFVKRIRSLGKSKMMTEHDKLRQKERHITLFMKNANKNRFPHIVLFNEGAVVLQVTKNDAKDDYYIHATKLKGKFGNYVLAQHKSFTLKTLASRNEGVVTTFDLKITNKYDSEDRMIHVVVFTAWSDISRPPESFKLLSLVRAAWALEETRSDNKCPTLVHAVSGTRRTGTYVILSMLCRQMSERRQLSIITACSTVRSYRYNVMSGRYFFIILLQALVTYAVDIGLIDRSKQTFKTACEFLRKAGAERVQSFYDY